MGEVEEVDERETSSTPAWACPARKNCSRNSPSWPRPVRNPSKAQPPYSTPIKETTETAGSTRVGCIPRYLLSDPLLELLGGPPFCTASMMPSKDPWRELRRIPLPRTQVNRESLRIS